MAQVGHLLPAITTVTSHARYYTLHAAVFAEAERRALDNAATRDLFRRAEVVVGAVSIAHQSADNSAHQGMRGVHGADRVAPRVDSGTVDLDALAADRGYVQAEWGFWGPYAGPEFSLGLLATGERKKTVPGPEADVAALQTGFEGLFDLTAHDTLTTSDLASADHLCVCRGDRADDGTLLRRLLINPNAQSMFASDRRSQTLRLLLRLLDLLGGSDSPESDLRHALTYGPEREVDTVTDLEAAAAWTGVLLRNEHVAAWRNLWKHLVDAIDGFTPIAALADTLADDLPDTTVGAFVDSLPAGVDQHGLPIDALATLDTAQMSRGAVLLAEVFVTGDRYGRLPERPQAYLQAERDEQFQQLTPGWTQDRFGDWHDLPLRDFATWLVRQLVARAERVSLAKASFDYTTGRFKVPTRVFVRDDHVFRDSREAGGGVSLRWDSAFQIMAGLGLVRQRDGRWTVTDLGRAA